MKLTRDEFNSFIEFLQEKIQEVEQKEADRTDSIKSESVAIRVLERLENESIERSNTIQKFVSLYHEFM